jgi:hypothetical protein
MPQQPEADQLWKRLEMYTPVRLQADRITYMTAILCSIEASFR